MKKVVLLFALVLMFTACLKMPITVEEAIEDTQKCEAAGMFAYVKHNGNNMFTVVCLPQSQSREVMKK